MKSRYAATALLIVIVLAAAALVTWHHALAEYAWNRWHAPAVAVLLSPDDANFAFAIGNYYFNGGAYDPSLAQTYYERAVANDPSLFQGHYQLGRVLFVEDELPQALAQLNLELQYHPTDLRTLYMRGLVYMYMDEYAAAESDFARFIAWVPTEWAGYNDYASVLAEDGKYAQAKSVLETAFTDATGAATNPWLWNNLGVQELNLKEYALAETAFLKAQTLAAAMTPVEFEQAYPGDGPTAAPAGLAAFQGAIAANLAEAEGALVDN